MLFATVLIITFIVIIALTPLCQSSGDDNNRSENVIDMSYDVARNLAHTQVVNSPKFVNDGGHYLTSLHLRNPKAPFTPTRNQFDDFHIRKLKENIIRLGPLCRIFFIGDGVIAKLESNQTLWARLEEKYAAIMLGFPGDKTENILHRLYSAVFLKDITSNPVVIVMAGMSNIIVGDKASPIATAVTNIVSFVKQNFPRSKIILLSLLPRAQISANKVVNELNSYFLSSYSKDTVVNFYDINVFFRTKADSPSPYLYHDTYFSPAGFEKFMSLIAPILASLNPLQQKLPPRTSLIK
jgi:hypothetical protein